MIRDKIQNLSHRVLVQLRNPRIIIRARADCGVQLVMISDVVTMQAIRARLKIGRCVNVTNFQCIQIGHDLACLGKSEPAIELQPVGAGWNARMRFCHGRKQTSNAQRPTSNTEIQSLISRFSVRCWAFGVVLHLLRHLDPEKAETLFQDLSGQIAQSESRTARRFR